MKPALIILIAITYNCVNAQIVEDIDPGFKNTLINQQVVILFGSQYFEDIDTNDDGEIQVSEAEAVQVLGLLDGGSGSLQGIEHLSNMENLSFFGFAPTQMDISQNQNITKIDVTYSELATLDVSQNTNLETLFLTGTELTTLDVSNNVNLIQFAIAMSPIENITLKNGNNTILEYVNIENNPLLGCITVDNVAYTESQLGDTWTVTDCPDAFFSQNEDCSLSLHDQLLKTTTLSPNPIKNKLQIKAELPIDLVEIINLHGIVLEKHPFQTSLDMSHLASGVYFIKVTSASENFVQKVLKI